MDTLGAMLDQAIPGCGLGTFSEMTGASKMAAVRAARSFFQYALDMRYAEEVLELEKSGMRIKVTYPQVGKKKDKLVLCYPKEQAPELSLMFAGTVSTAYSAKANSYELCTWMDTPFYVSGCES